MLFLLRTPYSPKRIGGYVGRLRRVGEEDGLVALLAETLTFRLAGDDFWQRFLKQLHAFLGQGAVPEGGSSRARELSFVELTDLLNGEENSSSEISSRADLAEKVRDRSPRARRTLLVLKRLRPALQRRRLLERQMTSAGVAQAAVVLCLELVPRAAMVIDARCDAVFANAYARRQMDLDRRHLTSRLQAALNSAAADFVLTPLTGYGLPSHWLAVENAEPRDPAPLLRLARARWSLTPREEEVLALLAEGLTNRGIAARLDCSGRTVEVHVARLLAKTGSENRAQLIARFWGDNCEDGEAKESNARS